jgi:hypothetical protein
MVYCNYWIYNYLTPPFLIIFVLLSVLWKKELCIFLRTVCSEEDHEPPQQIRAPQKESKTNIFTNVLNFPTFLKRISNTYYGIANADELNQQKQSSKFNDTQ